MKKESKKSKKSLSQLNEQLQTLQGKKVKDSKDSELITAVQGDIAALSNFLEAQRRELPTLPVLTEAKSQIDAQLIPLHHHQSQLLARLGDHQQKIKLHQQLSALLAKFESQFVVFEDKRDSKTTVGNYRQALLTQIQTYAALIRDIHDDVSKMNAEAARYFNELRGQVTLDSKQSTDNVEFVGMQALLLSKLNQGVSISEEKIDINKYVSMLEAKLQQLKDLVDTVSKAKSPDLDQLVARIRNLYEHCLDSIKSAAETYDRLTIPQYLMFEDADSHVPILVADIYRDRHEALVGRQAELFSKIAYIITEDEDVTKTLEALKVNALTPYTSHYKTPSSPKLPFWDPKNEAYKPKCVQLMEKLGLFLQAIKQVTELNVTTADRSLEVVPWELVFKALYEFAGKRIPVSVADISSTIFQTKSNEKLTTKNLENSSMDKLRQQRKDSAGENKEQDSTREKKEQDSDSKEDKMTKSLACGSIPILDIIHIFTIFKECVVTELKGTTLEKPIPELLTNLRDRLDLVIKTLQAKEASAKAKIAKLEQMAETLNSQRDAFGKPADYKQSQDQAASAFSALQSIWGQVDEVQAEDTSDIPLSTIVQSGDPVAQALKLDRSLEAEIQLTLEQINKDERNVTLIEAIRSIDPKHPWQAQMQSFAKAIKLYSEVKPEAKKETLAFPPSALAARDILMGSFKERLFEGKAEEKAEEKAEDKSWREERRKEWSEVKKYYDKAMDNQTQPLSIVRDMQRHLRETNLSQLTGTIVLSILDKYKKTWGDGATQKDQYVSSFRDTRLTTLQGVRLELVQDTSAQALSVLKLRDNENTVVLTNKSVAYFIVKGKFLTQKQVHGIDRQDLPLATSAELVEIKSPSVKVNKVIEDALSLAGLWSSPSSMEAILPMFKKAQFMKGEDWTVTFDIKALKGSAKIASPDERIVKEIGEFQQLCQDKEADYNYDVLLSETLLPLQATLKVMSEKPLECKPFILIRALNDAASKIVACSLERFAKLSFASKALNHSQFEQYFYGSVAWFREEVALRLRSGAPVKEQSITDFVGEIISCWSGSNPEFFNSPILQKLYGALGEAKDISEKINCIENFLTEAGNFDVLFDALQSGMEQTLAGEVSDARKHLAESNKESIFARLNKFGNPHIKTAAFKTFGTSDAKIKDMQEPEKSTEQLKALVEFLKQRDSWTPAFCKQGTLFKLATLQRNSSLVEFYNGKGENPIPGLMDSLRQTLKESSPIILQSAAFDSLQEAVASMEGKDSKDSIKICAVQIASFENSFQELVDQKKCNKNSKIKVALQGLKALTPAAQGYEQIKDESRPLGKIMALMDKDTLKGDPLVQLFKSLRGLDGTLEQKDFSNFLASTQGVQKWAIDLLWIAYQGGDPTRTSLFNELAGEKFRKLSYAEKCNCLRDKRLQKIEEFQAMEVAKIKECGRQIEQFLKIFNELVKHKKCSRNSKIEQALKDLVALATPGRIGFGAHKDEPRPLKEIMVLIKSTEVLPAVDPLVQLFRSLFKTDANLEQNLSRFLTSTKGVQTWAIGLLWTAYQGGDNCKTLFKELISAEFSNLSYVKKCNFLQVKVAKKIKEFMDLRIRNEQDIGRFVTPKPKEGNSSQSAVESALLFPIVGLYDRLHSFKNQIEQYSLAEAEAQVELSRNQAERDGLIISTGLLESKALREGGFGTCVTQFVESVKAVFPDLKESSSSSSSDSPPEVDAVSGKGFGSLSDRITELEETEFETVYRAHALSEMEHALTRINALETNAVGVPESILVSSPASSLSVECKEDRMVNVEETLAALDSESSIKKTVADAEKGIVSKVIIPKALLKLVRHGSLQEFMNVWFSDNLGTKIVPKSQKAPYPTRRKAWTPGVIEEIKSLNSKLPGHQAMQLIVESTRKMPDDKKIGLVLKLPSKSRNEAIIKAYQATPIAQKQSVDAKSLKRAASSFEEIADYLKVRIIVYKGKDFAQKTLHPEVNNGFQPIYLYGSENPDQYCPLIPSAWIASDQNHALHILLDIPLSMMESSQEEFQEDSPRTPAANKRGVTPETQTPAEPPTPQTPMSETKRPATPITPIRLDLNSVESPSLAAPMPTVEQQLAAERNAEVKTEVKTEMKTPEVKRSSTPKPLAAPGLPAAAREAFVCKLVETALPEEVEVLCPEGDEVKKEVLSPKQKQERKLRKLQGMLMTLVNSVPDFLGVWSDARLDAVCYYRSSRIVSIRAVCQPLLVQLCAEVGTSTILVEAPFHQIKDKRYFQLQDKTFEHKEESFARAVFVASRTVNTLEGRGSDYAEIRRKIVEKSAALTLQKFLSNYLGLNITIYKKNAGEQIEEVPTILEASKPTIRLMEEEGRFYPLISATWCLQTEPVDVLTAAIKSFNPPVLLSTNTASFVSNGLTPQRQSTTAAQQNGTPSSSSSSTTTMNTPSALSMGGDLW